MEDVNPILTHHSPLNFEWHNAAVPLDAVSSTLTQDDGDEQHQYH